MENLETLENQEIELTKTELQECDSHEFACDNLTKAAMIAPELPSIPAPIAAKNTEDWVTENFTWREFLHSQTAERLGLKNEPTASEKQNIQAVAQWLEKLRALLAEKYGRVIPIRITSGFRSQAVNRAVHGAPTSAHRFGNAADIQAVGLSIKQLAYDIFEFIQSGKLPKLDQLIREMPRHGGQWVHIGLKNHNGAVRNQILLYEWKASAAKNAYISVAALKKVETNLA